MIYTLDDESRKKIEDLSNLQEHVAGIHASIHADDDGREEIQISINLLPSFPTLAPSAASGHILNNIASIIQSRATEIPVPAVISFSKEGE